MFAKVIIFSGLLAISLCAPVDEPVAILAQTSDILPDGSFQSNYETADGTKVEQTGTIKQVGEEVVQTIHGSISYTDKEGNKHDLTYVADENGFQPQSADLPVVPEIPLPIQKSLEYNAAHPEPMEH
ncbi:unnamed protein product [Ceutorhynchus assimilis]|uniref:Uncharacterized protein n=1 Tax=Ceutorhynchus assimilis TaxID=467358 RepID=A0A9N9MUI9_9CUCU|nr:unnamed protein product [Ceutorhynchus assimilis]